MKTAKKHHCGRLGRFARAHDAVSALEYAILVSVIALAVGGAIVTFSGDMTQVFPELGERVDEVDTDGTLK